MVNYQNGKIYKIENLGGNMCYIGSTTKDYLSKRMVQHRSLYKRWKDGKCVSNISVFKMFEKYGLDQCRIVLIELVPCDTKDELLKREAHYIRTLECVNKNQPIITKEERTEQQRQYRDGHKNEIKKYNDEHKNEMQTYRDTHKEKLNALRKAIVICKCGMEHQHRRTTDHKKTKQHLNFIAYQPIF